MGCYDEIFISWWESSQSDLDFNSLCRNQREQHRNVNAARYGEFCEIGQKSILIETVNGNSNGLIMN